MNLRLPRKWLLSFIVVIQTIIIQFCSIKFNFSNLFLYTYLYFSKNNTQQQNIVSKIPLLIVRTIIIKLNTLKVAWPANFENNIKKLTIKNNLIII